MIGRLDEAELNLRKAIAISSDTQGAEHPRTLTRIYNLADVHRIRGNYDEAESLLVSVLDAQKRVHGESDHRTASTIAVLGKLNLQNGQFQKAEPLLEQALQIRRELLGEEHSRTLDSKDGQAELMIRLEQFSGVEELLRDCQKIREKRFPDRWNTFWSSVLLAQSLSQQSQFEEAERLMLKGYAGLKQRKDRIPYGDRRILRTAVENTVDLYQRWNRTDEASKWQDELKKFEKERSEENGHEK